MTDWLARKYRGVIDFRLPGDPLRIPTAVMDARVAEYYQQIRRHGEPRNSRPPPAPPSVTPDIAPQAAPAPASPHPAQDDPPAGLTDLTESGLFPGM